MDYHFTVPILDTHDIVRDRNLSFTFVGLVPNAHHRFQRGVYPAEDFTAVKKYGLNMLGAHPPKLPLASTSSPNHYCLLSLGRRPGQSIHQEDHGPTEQVDAKV